MCLRVDILTFIKCTNFFPANYNYVSMIFDWFFRTPKTLSFNQFGMSDFPFWMKQVMPNLRHMFLIYKFHACIERFIGFGMLFSSLIQTRLTTYHREAPTDPQHSDIINLATNRRMVKCDTRPGSCRIG